MAFIKTGSATTNAIGGAALLKEHELSVYLNLAQLIISAVLIVVILLQAKGAGFSGTFSTEASVFRTRRGVERTLFRLTIGLAVVFVLMSLLSVVMAG